MSFGHIVGRDMGFHDGLEINLGNIKMKIPSFNGGMILKLI